MKNMFEMLSVVSVVYREKAEWNKMTVVNRGIKTIMGEDEEEEEEEEEKEKGNEKEK